MINRRVLSAAAVMALVLPFAVPAESFAQNYMAPPRTGSYSGVIGQGGANLGRGFQAQQNRAAVGAPQGRVGNWQGNGGSWQGNRGGNWNGGYRGNYRGGGYGGSYIPGAVAGAIVGGAIASNSYGYYGGPGYYDQGYYDDSYYDDSAVAAVPGDGGDDTYCRQTYRSYDPRSGTYLGLDGLRHSCP
jgi:hypothetical protein